MLKLEECPNCYQKVIFNKDGKCPSCKNSKHIYSSNRPKKQEPLEQKIKDELLLENNHLKSKSKTDLLIGGIVFLAALITNLLGGHIYFSWGLVAFGGYKLFDGLATLIHTSKKRDWDKIAKDRSKYSEFKKD